MVTDGWLSLLSLSSSLSPTLGSSQSWLVVRLLYWWSQLGTPSIWSLLFMLGEHFLSYSTPFLLRQLLALHVPCNRVRDNVYGNAQVCMLSWQTHNIHMQIATQIYAIQKQAGTESNNWGFHYYTSEVYHSSTQNYHHNQWAFLNRPLHVCMLYPKMQWTGLM